MTTNRKRYTPPPPTARYAPRVDGLSIVVRKTQHPAGGSAAVTEGFFCEWAELDVSLEEAAELASAVAWDADEQVYHPFVVEQRLAQASWGADATGVSFLLDLVNSVSSELIIGGLGYAVAKMRGKLSRSGGNIDGDLEPARWSIIRAVAQVFGEDVDDVRVTDLTSAGGVVQAKASGSGGTYSARIATLETGDPLVHVTRD